ncbi:MAG: transposase [Coriobacteriales bacterium]|nr:transposase [Coriobacteriales bacterium]
MVRTMRVCGESNVYHVVTRGAGHCLIFEDNADREHYLALLDTACEQNNISLLAWCLMSNHVHLLVEAPMEHISQMMRMIGSAYALYFNRRHGRMGPLFQGRFKSEPVETDEYLCTVVRYIHRNPLKAGVANIDKYPWSSYCEYIKQPKRVDTSQILALMDGRPGFIEFHMQDDPSAPCIDIERGRKVIADDEALSIAQSALPGVSIESIYCMDRASRDESLRKLSASHLSIRQIERLTGVARSVVSKAARGQ